MPVNDTELAYLAGFFDGEGTILISKRYSGTLRGCRYNLSVRVVNTYKPIVEVYQKRWGGYIYNKPSAKTYHKQAYQWYINCKKAEKFLKDISPYLLEKKIQAEIALNFRSLQEELNLKRLADYKTRRSYTDDDYLQLALLRDKLLSTRGAAANRRRRDEPIFTQI